MLGNLIIKDLKRFMRDRSALIVILAMPIVITTILGFSLQSMFSLGDNNHIDPITIAIVDQDDKTYDFNAFIADLSGNPMGGGMLKSMDVGDLAKIYDQINPRDLFFETFLNNEEIKSIASYQVMSEAEAKQKLDDNQISGIVYLPKSYSKDMTMNLLTPFRNPVNLQVVPNNERIISSMILKALISGFTENVDSAIAKKNVSLEQQIQYNLPMSFSDLAQKADSEAFVQYEIKTTVVDSVKPIDSKAYYAIAMLSMFLLFTAAMGGALVLEEKDLFTYDRHLMAGVHPFGILLGKMAVLAVVTTLQITVLVLYAKVAFGVNWGSITNLLAISASIVFAISSLGTLLAMIGSITRSYKIAKVFENGLIQVLALFGGSYIPVEQMPAIIQSLSAFVINGVILKAYLFNMMGYSLEQLMPYIVSILINGIVFLAMAMALYFMKEGRSDVAHHIPQTVDPA